MRQLYRLCLFTILWCLFFLIVTGIFAAVLGIFGENLWPVGLIVSAGAAWVGLWGLRTTRRN